MNLPLVLLTVLWLAPALAADPTPAFVEPKLGEGCWVRFFAQKDFREPVGRLAGHLYIPSLADPGLVGKYEERKFFQVAQSVVVGPEATLIAYSEPGFREELATLEHGRRVADLARLGIPERLASLKIVCDKRSGQR